MEQAINSRERVLLALNHKEPDRIPLDIGGNSQTGIHVKAYENLVRYLEMEPNFPVIDNVQRLAGISEELFNKFAVDTRGLYSATPGGADDFDEEDEDYTYFTDRWGIRFRKPKVEGYYYDMIGHPLSGEISRHDIDRFKFPDPSQMRQDMPSIVQSWKTRSNPPAIVLEATEGGMTEFGFWLRGFENFYMDIASDPQLAGYLLDKILEFKMCCWETALAQIGEDIDVAWEVDDLGFQNRPMFSPDFYRKTLKPRHQKLFAFIKSRVSKRLFIGFHSCGSIRAFIPDLIEAGIDALNPIQLSAAKMDPKELKKEFGRDLTFWGGGINTQSTLPGGSPEEVREEVRRHIGELAPGGGFVFAAVHNIQADVPPQNIVAMVEALHEYGNYA